VIKALGILIDGNLNWDAQAESAFKKGQNPNEKILRD
jgi:hypothetical protein